MAANPSLRSITFRKAPSPSYTRDRKEIQFQLLSYDGSEQFPDGVDNYDWDTLTTNGDFYYKYKDKTGIRHPPEETDHWLQLYGRTQEGFSIALLVNYWPCLMVCLPDNWGCSQKRDLLRLICRKRNLSTGCILGEVQYYHRLSGFHPDLEADTPKRAKFPFLKIWCRSKGYFYLVRNFFKYTKLTVGGLTNHEFPCIEMDIPPVLQLLETYNGRPSGMLKIATKDLKPSPTRITHCDLEYTCAIEPLRGDCPLTAVEADEVYPLVLFSFDIEAVPPNAKSFPDANNEADYVVSICSTVKNMSTGEICIASHTVGNHTPVKHSHAVHQFRYDRETDMIEAWRDFLIWVDPDITTGYNIHRFDWPYLNTRMEKFNAGSRFFYISRLITFRSVIDEKEFTSKAHGSSTSKKFHTPGRIDVDLCTYIMRNYKLKSYKLGRVAMHFLKQDKTDLTIPEMIKCIRSGIPEEMARMVEYCIQDTLLPILLWEDQYILESIVEMSRVTYVFLQDLFDRGQMFKVVSQLFINGRQRGFALTHLPKTESSDSYKGATVLDIKSGFYEMLAVLDFASLYPSIMKGKNLCYTTLVTDKKYANLEEKGYKYFESKTDLGEYKFEQALKGLLPIVIDWLLAKRSATKKKMKEAKLSGNRALAVILNARQLALKVSCNSIYGFTGATQSEYWCPQIASAVTAYGRYLIDNTKNIIEEKFREYGADVVYGDTDSVMVNFTKIPHTDEGFRQVFDIGEQASKLISSSFESSIVLEMEKVYRPAIMQVKKHYAALAFETKTDPGKIDAKGIALVRRDFCDFQQNAYAAILHILLYERDLDKALAEMEKRLQLLVGGKYEFNELVLSRKLAKSYKNPNIMQKVVADKMEKRTPGGGPRSGDRVDFVVIVLKSQHEKAPMYKKVESAEYAKKTNMKLDVKYYIESFMPSMKALFEPFNITRRLKTLFSKYICQAHRVIHGNPTILKFYTKTPVAVLCDSDAEEKEKTKEEEEEEEEEEKELDKEEEEKEEQEKQEEEEEEEEQEKKKEKEEEEEKEEQEKKKEEEKDKEKQCKEEKQERTTMFTKKQALTHRTPRKRKCVFTAQVVHPVSSNKKTSVKPDTTC